MAKKTTEVTAEQQQSKRETIEALKKKMEKDFGKGTMIGANDKPQEHESISTGSIGLDKAMGIGGFAKGRITEIYGPESSGKTTLALEAIAQAHKKKDAYCAFVDAEHALDITYATSLGIDLDRLEICQPDYGEQALNITKALIESKQFDIIIVDSVAALVPKAELEGEVGDAAMGKQSRMMSQVLRMIVSSVAKSGTVLIFINQMRDKIGVMFGSPETTTGGNALKFYASMRLDIRRQLSKDVKEGAGEDALRVGNQVTVKVIKNKLAPPFRQAEFNIMYGEGIDKAGEVLNAAVKLDIITKTGTFYYYNADSIGQGAKQARATLKENKEMYEEIRERVQACYVADNFVPTEKELEDGKG